MLARAITAGGLMTTLQRNWSPWVYFTATATVVLSSYFAFNTYSVDPSYYFAPILLLAMVHATLNFARQIYGGTEYSIKLPSSLGMLLRRALTRYLVWLVIIYGGFWLLRSSPFHDEPAYVANWRFYEVFFQLYLVAGLPYFCITLMCRASRSEDFYDPAIRIIHMLNQPALRFMRGDSLRSVVRVFRNRYNRKMILNLVMRAYFIPIMLMQVLGYVPYALNLHNAVFDTHDFVTILFWLVAMLWLIDLVNAGLAYLLESRWLENRSRSIDMTIIGWAVCLFCYLPLNNVTAAVFPFAPQLAINNANALIIPSNEFLIGLKIAEIILLSLHVYIDAGLGLSVANITLKKLQTRGPYALIRHPGTTTKLLLWFVIAFGYSEFWTAKYLFGYLAWAALYIMRALTEERHLRQYAEYRDYQQQVRYRFIPGVF